MAKLLKLRRGTTSQHSSFTGAEGEVTVDTDKDVLVVNDGSTAGGHPLAAEDMSNVTSASIAGRLNADSIATSKIAGGALPTDVTVASANIVDGTIATGDIANDAVTFAKMQNIGTPSFLGRNSSGTGDVENLSSSDVRTMLNVENGATADQSAAEILTAIKTVDGSGSGLDADTVDGIEASNFVRSDADDTMNGNYTITGSGDQKLALNGSDPYIRWQEGGTNKAYIQWNSAGFLQIANQETDEHIKIANGTNGLIFRTGATDYTVWHSGNDGSGSGLDADTVDGIQASNFVRSDQGDTMNGAYTINTTTNEHLILQGSNDPYIRWKEGTTNKAYIQWNATNGALDIVNQESNEWVRISSGSNGLIFNEGGNARTVWHSGNDGAGSGLDADYVDGIQASNFLRSDTADSASGDITFNGGGGAVTIGANSDIRFNAGNWTGEAEAKIQHHQGIMYITYPNSGTLRMRDSAGNNNFTLDTSGNGTFVGNVTAYSDRRLKTDIHTINDALGICGKLRGVSYKWIKDGKPSIGVIAQEIEEVLPEVVLNNVDTNLETGETTEVKSVDYGKIVGVLINAINELKAEVDELKGGK